MLPAMENHQHKHVHTKGSADTRTLTCLLALCLPVFLTTWLPGMRAPDAHLASAVSTSMGNSLPLPYLPSLCFTRRLRDSLTRHASDILWRKKHRISCFRREILFKIFVVLSACCLVLTDLAPKTNLQGGPRPSPLLCGKQRSF